MPTPETTQAPTPPAIEITDEAIAALWRVIEPDADPFAYVGTVETARAALEAAGPHLIAAYLRQMATENIGNAGGHTKYWLRSRADELDGSR